MRDRRRLFKLLCKLVKLTKRAELMTALVIPSLYGCGCIATSKAIHTQSTQPCIVARQKFASKRITSASFRGSDSWHKRCTYLIVRHRKRVIAAKRRKRHQARYYAPFPDLKADYDPTTLTISNLPQLQTEWRRLYEQSLLL